MAESTLMIKIDEDLMRKGEIVFNRFDLDFTSAFKLFVQKSVETDDLSFLIEDDEDLDGPYTEEEEALCYCPENVAAVLEGIKSLEEGRFEEITLDELRDMLK